jgi:hypothetical protein
MPAMIDRANLGLRQSRCMKRKVRERYNFVIAAVIADNSRNAGQTFGSIAWQIEIVEVPVLSVWGEFDRSEGIVGSIAGKTGHSLTIKESMLKTLDENRIVISSSKTLQFAAHARSKAKLQTNFSLAQVIAAFFAIAMS